MWSALGKLNRVLISVGRCTGIAEVNDVVFVKRKIRIVIKSSTHRSFPSLFFTDPADGNTHLCFVFKLPLQKRKRFPWIATTVVTRCGNMAVLCKQKTKLQNALDLLDYLRFYCFHPRQDCHISRLLLRWLHLHLPRVSRLGENVAESSGIFLRSIILGRL